MLRNNQWTGRDAEMQGCLRLFAPAPPGLGPPGRGPKAVSAAGAHHNDASALQPTQKEVAQLHTHLRHLLMAAVLKDSETRPQALGWLAAVVAASELTLKAPKTPQGMLHAAQRLRAQRP